MFAYARTGKPQWVLDVLITQTHMHIVEQENLIEVTVLHMSGRFRLSFVNTQPKNHFMASTGMTAMPLAVLT